MSSVDVNPQLVVDSKGQAKSVLLSVADYKRLVRRLEDLEDALALDQTVRTAKEFVGYRKVRAELRKTRRRPKP
jgi:PHD/YefM family antitoxin component YafN of YafNO toxin-antitoxin module